ncbi:uncharacterized protein EI97DRAFT_461095 [Westerdykella ornata]|uniref:DUF6594 domain-containing protein n=1 Tax=Westerdykella ornata TaxID=318751 RepID=A0A6A6JB56_WESOR|nr:uncharacterized protein EI97DRAFT_461095 [Westerdykella ornata]KAF2273434.1 hypothetical protein EI97DRAFT_461095 [Westerdykella ornata]
MAMPSPKTPGDVELGTLRDGYPALAAWIARDPDNEALVFRKFGRLGARNLLHLQSRLIALEKELDELDEDARRSDDLEARQSLRRWETLMKYAGDKQRGEKKTVEKLEELRKVLREYYETLLLQAQLAELQTPSTRVLLTFRDYLEGRAFKSADMQSMPIISGRAKDFLSDPTDLVALRKAKEEDVLSKLLQDHWAFRRRESNDPLDRTTVYKHRTVARTVGTISMIAAAILLIGAIISLHAVTDSNAKLGLVAMYTLLFALSVATLTNARRAEVFAASAAYAAVLVVFVSGDLGGSKTGQCLIQLRNGIFQIIQCPG